MKKSLIALTVAASCTVTWAQTPPAGSVQVFGVIDVGLARLSTDASTKSGMSTGGANIARMGMRGSEDLGGGSSASFWYEAGIDTEIGAGKGPNGSLIFNRRATVSLSNKGIGELRMGRDDSASFLNTLIFDPFLTNGVGGTMAFTMLGIPNAATAAGGAPIQISRAFSYFTPANLGGFYAQAQVTLGEQFTGVANSKQGDYRGMRLGYRQGPLHVAYANGKLTGDVAANDLTASNVGLMYDFGPIKPILLWARESRTGTDLTALQIGFTAPMGAGEWRGSYATYDRSNSNADWSKLSVGYLYNLSKRTALYGTVAHLSNKSGAAKTIGVQGMTSPANVLGGGNNGFQIGVRHNY